MPLTRFTFPDDISASVSPQDLRNKLAEQLGCTCVAVSHDGKHFELGEYGPAVYLETDEAGNAVETIVDFSRVAEVKHVVATYRVFRAQGWIVDDNRRVLDSSTV